MSYSPRDIEQVFSEIGADNDRAAILVGGAMIEHALELSIEARLRKPSGQSDRGQLFTSIGVFRDFSEKIIGAYLLKIIGTETRRELDQIRRIRNRAAHDMNPISFAETQEISSRCSQLTLAEDLSSGFKDMSNRDKFITFAMTVSLNLMMRANDPDAELAELSTNLAYPLQL